MAQAVANTDYLPAENPVASGTLTLNNGGATAGLSYEEGWHLDFGENEFIMIGGGSLIINGANGVTLGGSNDFSSAAGVAVMGNAVFLGSQLNRDGVSVKSYGAITDDDDVVTKKYVDEAIKNAIQNTLEASY